MRKMTFYLKDGTAITANVATVINEAVFKDMLTSQWLSSHGIASLSSMTNLVYSKGGPSANILSRAFRMRRNIEVQYCDGDGMVAMLDMSKISLPEYNFLLSNFGDSATKSFNYDCNQGYKQTSIIANAILSNAKAVASIKKLGPNSPYMANYVSMLNSVPTTNFPDPRIAICTDGQGVYLIFTDYD